MSTLLRIGTFLAVLMITAGAFPSEAEAQHCKWVKVAADKVTVKVGNQGAAITFGGKTYPTYRDVGIKVQRWAGKKGLTICFEVTPCGCIKSAHLVKNDGDWAPVPGEDVPSEEAN